MTQTERSYSVARATAQLARGYFIELTHELPKGAPQEVLRLWNVADAAVLEFIRAVERAEDVARAKENSRS